MNLTDISPVDADFRRYVEDLDRLADIEERRETVANALLCNLCAKQPDDLSCEFADYVLQDGTNQAVLLAALFRNDRAELERLRGVYWDAAMKWADEQAREFAK